MDGGAAPNQLRHIYCHRLGQDGFEAQGQAELPVLDVRPATAMQALFDRSGGFYRWHLVLTIKEKPADRVDNPALAEKMKAEIEGIFL